MKITEATEREKALEIAVLVICKELRALGLFSDREMERVGQRFYEICETSGVEKEAFTPILAGMAAIADPEFAKRLLDKEGNRG